MDPYKSTGRYEYGMVQERNLTILRPIEAANYNYRTLKIQVLQVWELTNR